MFRTKKNLMPPRGYKKRPFGFRYHGYYCGPGWSAGKFQNSVSGGPDPVDALDRICQRHDSQYASGKNRKRADEEFYRDAMKLGYPKAQVAAMLVGGQGLLRTGGRRHWSTRPAKKQKTVHIRDDSEFPFIRTKKKEIIEPEMTMQGLRYHQSFNQRRLPGVAGYAGGAIKSKKKTKERFDKYYKNIWEVQGKADDPNCIYNGHCSMPTRQVLYSSVAAMFRALFKKASLDIINPDQLIMLTGNGGIRTIIFELRTDPVSAASTWASQFQIIDGGYTLNTLTEAFVTAYVTYVATNPQVIFDKVYMVDQLDTPTMTPVDSPYYTLMDLHSATIHCVGKSQLKIQNRTKHLATTADDAELTTAVDAVPLIGKSYMGNSAGMWPKAFHDAAVNLVADWGNALIGAAAGTNELLQEPPAPSSFCNVKKQGSLKLEPGEIKTSYLNDSIHMNFSKLLRKLAPVFGKVYNVAFGIGSYRIMALEKLIGIKSSATVQPEVEIGYEINSSVMALCKPKDKVVLRQNFLKFDNVDY